MGARFKHNENRCAGFPDLHGDAKRDGAFAGNWTDGVLRLYMTLAQDFVWENPIGNCIFLDNHDMGQDFLRL